MGDFYTDVPTIPVYYAAKNRLGHQKCRTVEHQGIVRHNVDNIMLCMVVLLFRNIILIIQKLFKQSFDYIIRDKSHTKFQQK